MQQRGLKILQILSIILVCVLSLWLLMVLVATNHKPQPFIIVTDRDGKTFVSGENRVVFRPDHWWRDVAIKAIAPDVALLAALVTLWYSTRRLASKPSVQ